MAYICAYCGKGKTVGRQHRHKRGVAGKRWNSRTTVTGRDFKPNLQKFTMEKNGSKETILLCTKCIKKFKKEASNN